MYSDDIALLAEDVASLKAATELLTLFSLIGVSL